VPTALILAVKDRHVLKAAADNAKATNAKAQ
jgi:hypothetical protein